MVFIVENLKSSHANELKSELTLIGELNSNMSKNKKIFGTMITEIINGANETSFPNFDNQFIY
jgi:hypothetical protein